MSYVIQSDVSDVMPYDFSVDKFFSFALVWISRLGRVEGILCRSSSVSKLLEQLTL